MRGKSIVVILMLLLLVASSKSSYDVHATTLDDLKDAQNELNQSQADLDEVEEDLSGLNSTQRQLKKELDALQEELQGVVDELTELELQIQNKQNDISTTQEALTKAQGVEEDQYESMSARIRFIYEQGDVNYLDLLLTSSSFSDFINKTEYVEQLAEYDRAMLESYKETVAEIDATKQILEQEEAELLVLEQQTIEKQEEVAALVEAASDKVADAQSQIDAAELEKAAKEKEIKEQEATVTELRKQYEAELALAELAQNSTWRDISSVTFQDGDLKILASIIYCEAGGEPYAGQLAVGAVVINRLLSTRYPNTIVGVIYQPYQFSPVRSGRMEIALANNKATQSCYNAATEAMSGITNVENCLYFRTPIEGVIPRFTIGGHIFY